MHMKHYPNPKPALYSSFLNPVLSLINIIILLSIDLNSLLCYNIPVNGALAQLGAHHTGSVGVRGSNPLCSTIFKARKWL